MATINITDPEDTRTGSMRDLRAVFVSNSIVGLPCDPDIIVLFVAQWLFVGPNKLTLCTNIRQAEESICSAHACQNRANRAIVFATESPEDRLVHFSDRWSRRLTIRGRPWFHMRHRERIHGQSCMSGLVASNTTADEVF